MPNAARLELPTCPDGKLIQLAELAGINCIHLVTVSERDAVEALTGLVLYHHLSSQDRAAVHEHRRTLPSPFRAALDRVQERFAHGSVQWDETRRNTQTVQGQRVDYDALGIRPNSLDVQGAYLRYAVVEDTFMIFRDDPTLWYYTQDARQGSFSFLSAAATRYTMRLATSLYAARRLTRIPGLNKVVERLMQASARQREVFIFGGGLVLQEKIPILREIVGAEIPRRGTTRVLVYISKDGVSWPRRARFDISPEARITTHTWTSE